MQHLWEKLIHDISQVLRQGDPPISSQLVVLALAYIVVQSYFWYKRKVRRAKVPSTIMTTNVFLLAAIAVILGAVNFALDIYRTHLIRIWGTLF